MFAGSASALHLKVKTENQIIAECGSIAIYTEYKFP